MMSLSPRVDGWLATCCSLALLSTLLLGSPRTLGADDTIADQAILTIQPVHGTCDQDVLFTGEEFVPESTVIVRPLYSASGDPYPDGPVFEIVADEAGSFTFRASPCPSNVPVAGRIVLWSAEPPGRPFFADGPFALVDFTIDASRYFPETGHSVGGVFLDVWAESGGVPIFGYPLTPEYLAQVPDAAEMVSVQYFERQRFELHPEYQGTPYEVLLGRLGVDLLQSQGRDWRAFPKADPSQSHYFPETGHAIATEFWDTWSSMGLEFGDPDVSFRESLALFGYPVSQPMMETNADGDTILTQYFERAVFEWHPLNHEPWNVLLRRVGAEMVDLQSISTTAPLPEEAGFEKRRY